MDNGLYRRNVELNTPPNPSQSFIPGEEAFEKRMNLNRRAGFSRSAKDKRVVIDFDVTGTPIYK